MDKGAAQDNANERWPPYCCVPAFLLRAISSLCGNMRVDSDLRRAVADGLNVAVPLDDPNPWGLRTSDKPAEWGVSETTASARFAAVREIVCARSGVSLDLFPLSNVAFEQYEDEVVKRLGQSCVLAIGFAYEKLADLRGYPAAVTKRAHHLVRLSPLDGDHVTAPTVASPDFGWGYRGAIQVFDDSGEWVGPDASVLWQDLLSAARWADGALWSVAADSARTMSAGASSKLRDLRQSQDAASTAGNST